MNQGHVAIDAPSGRATEIGMSRVGRWFVNALRLWRQSPFLLIGVALFSFVVEGLLQTAIPYAGVILSKWLTPIFMAGQFVAIDHLARDRRMRFVDLFAGCRRRFLGRLLLLGLLSLVVFVSQVGVIWLTYGSSVLDEVVLGRFGKHPEAATARFMLTLILPGLIPAMIIAFALPLVILGGRDPVSGIVLSAKRVFGAPLSFAAFTFVWAASFAVSMLTPYVGLLLLLLASTWSMATTYMAYRDLFEPPATPV